MANTKSQPAAAELKEFKRERRQVAKTEEAGETEPTLRFREKWFGRYPQFVPAGRLSMYQAFNDLQKHLEDKAACPPNQPSI